MALSFSASPSLPPPFRPEESSGVDRSLLPSFLLPSFLPSPAVRNVPLYPILQAATEASDANEVAGDEEPRAANGRTDGRPRERRNPVQSGEQKKGQMSVKRGRALAVLPPSLSLSACPVSDRQTDRVDCREGGREGGTKLPKAKSKVRYKMSYNPRVYEGPEPVCNACPTEKSARLGPRAALYVPLAAICGPWAT